MGEPTVTAARRKKAREWLKKLGKSKYLDDPFWVESLAILLAQTEAVAIPEGHPGYCCGACARAVEQAKRQGWQECREAVGAHLQSTADEYLPPKDGSKQGWPGETASYFLNMAIGRLAVWVRSLEPPK